MWGDRNGRFLVGISWSNHDGYHVSHQWVQLFALLGTVSIGGDISLQLQSVANWFYNYLKIDHLELLNIPSKSNAIEYYCKYL